MDSDRLGFRRRAWLGSLVVALAAGGAVAAAVHERHPFVAAFERMGLWPVTAALACGLVGVGATYPAWRGVLAGMGVRMPWAEGARIFFTSQLGKYLPGAVWPALMQMEAGRRRGGARRTMLAANLVALALSCTTGLLLAAAVLPAYDHDALKRYWWGLLAVPFLLVLLHPRALTGLADRAAAVLGRAPLGVRLHGSAELRASGWSVLSWFGFGAELAVLACAASGWSVATVLLSLGAVTLAVPLGIMFVPAPAGLGVRDVVLVLALQSSLPTGTALAVVVASRALVTAADLLAAGLTLALPRDRGVLQPDVDGRAEGAGERTRTSTPLGTRT